MWQNVTLKSGKSSGGKKMSVHEINLRYYAEKKSYGLTLNQYLNEAIEKGGYYYFGLMKESESGMVAMVLQKKQTLHNVKMHRTGGNSTKKESYNYSIACKETVNQIYETLGLKRDGSIRLTISDDQSKNNTCMLFIVTTPDSNDPFNGLTD